MEWQSRKFVNEGLRKRCRKYLDASYEPYCGWRKAICVCPQWLENLSLFCVLDAHFYIGKSETPSPFQGMVLASAQDGDAPIGRSDGQDIVLKLRSGGNLRAHRWLAVMSNSQNVGLIAVKEVNIHPEANQTNQK